MYNKTGHKSTKTIGWLLVIVERKKMPLAEISVDGSDVKIGPFCKR